MRSFSWTLALRYLNPLRAFVSVITLISLLGVAFGVMVLIVVLSVHAGFERNLKQMLLGFSPHLTVSSAYQGQALHDWEKMEGDLVKLDEVEGAYALVEGHVLLDVRGWNKPVLFRGINVDSEAQVKSLEEMLIDGKVELVSRAKTLNEVEAEEGGEAAEFDGGAVVSKILADNLFLEVGDSLRLIASSNLDAVIRTYRTKGNGRAYEIYAERFGAFEKKMHEIFKEEGGLEVASSGAVTEAYRLIQDFVENPDDPATPLMRISERRIVDEVLDILNTLERQEEGRDYFMAGTREQILAKLGELRDIDLDKADLEDLGQIEKFVLPMTLEVTGIYQDVKRAQGPELFVSLQAGQTLRGLDVGLVEAVGVRIADPYLANLVVEDLQENVGEDYFVSSWMRQHKSQFELVKTEKVMMSFALSFITLLSAFSIMAVMYTMTVQKRQEIGVMKALGASPVQIVKVFVYQGLIVGVGGALLGLGMGLLAIRFRENIMVGLRGVGIDPFPKDFQGMEQLPARVIPEQLVVICIVAVILCLLAALVPAMLAAFRDPAKSLRNL